MTYGAGGGDQPGQMLASEAERERCQAVLKHAFEDQRLTQDEFESGPDPLSPRGPRISSRR